MVGIQLRNGRGAVAVYGESGPEVLATDEVLADFVSRVTARTGTPCDRAVIGVPAYYNDAQRTAVLAEARKAGIARPRLVNESTAAALAFAASRAKMPDTCLVLSLSDEGRSTRRCSPIGTRASRWSRRMALPISRPRSSGMPRPSSAC